MLVTEVTVTIDVSVIVVFVVVHGAGVVGVFDRVWVSRIGGRGFV